MGHVFRRGLAWAATALLGITTLQAAPAGVSGAVLAPDGSGLPGATVTLTSPRTGESVTVISGEHGVFRAARLDPGTWTLRANLPGFAEMETEAIEVPPETTVTVEVRLAESRFQAAMTVIGSAPRDQLAGSEISELGSREIADALSRLAGMSALRKGGTASDIVLRGYKEENLNVLVDGVRVNGACPSNMDPSAFHTDLSEVDHVEVSRGPFDVRNAGSLGGVVNLVTRSPEPGLAVQARLAGGSFGYVNPSATVSWGSDAVSWLVGAAMRTSKPYEDGHGRRFTELANYRTDARDTDAYGSTAGWIRSVIAPAPDQRVSLSYMRQEVDQVLYPYLLMDGVWDNTDRAEAGWKLTRDDGLVASLSARAYYSRVRHWMTDGLRVSGASAPRGWSMGSQADTDTWGARVDARLDGVSVGLEAVRRRWDITTMMAGMQYRPQYSLPDVTVDGLGAYAELVRELGRGARLEAGVRLDTSRARADAAKAATDLYWAYNQTRRTAADDTLPSGNVRLIWEAGGGLELSAGAGRTVRMPDPRERYFGLRRMGADWVGNPNLDPVRNTGLSLQASWRGSGAWVSAALFNDWLNDAVILHNQSRVNDVAGVMNSRALSYVNLDARQRGAELSVTLTPLEGLFLSSEVSWVRGSKDTDPQLNVRSTALAQMPPLHSRLAVRWDRGPWFSELEGVFVARQDRVDTDLQEEPTPGFAAANLRVGIRRGGLLVALAADNLFDRYYVEHLSYLRDPFRSGTRVPEPGRRLTVSLSFVH